MESSGVVEQDQEALLLWNNAVGFVGSGKLDTASEIFLQLAQANYKGAAFAIGRILAEDNTHHANLEKAIGWFRKAVNDENDVRAMVALARIYLAKGGKNNTELALNFLEQATKFDDVVALSILGEVYERGYIGQADAETAKLYYLRAAKLGAVFAMVRLANLSYGQKNFVKCLYWRIKAICSAFKIALIDREDKRLWRINGV